MAKINVTYNRGYHLSHDFDPLEFEREQKRKRKEEKRKHGGVLPEEDRKQTMDLEFGVRCLKCRYCIPRRTRVYARIHRVEKHKVYGEWICDFEFHCVSCGEVLALRNDYDRPLETGGFVVLRNCERLAGAYDEAQAQDAQQETLRAHELANEDFEGEAKVKEHQTLEEEATKLAALVEKQNARDAQLASEAALQYVADAASRVMAARTVPVTAEDEERFRLLQHQHGVTAVPLLSTAEWSALFAIDFSQLDQPPPEAPVTTTAAPAPPAPATSLAHAQKKKARGVLSMLADD